jgi:hypothetical protein
MPSGAQANSQKHLDVSREDIVEYYLLRILKSPLDGSQVNFDRQAYAGRRAQMVEAPTRRRLSFDGRSSSTKGVPQDLQGTWFLNVEQGGFALPVPSGLSDANWKKAYEQFRAAREIPKVKALIQGSLLYNNHRAETT